MTTAHVRVVIRTTDPAMELPDAYDFLTIQPKELLMSSKCHVLSWQVVCRSLPDAFVCIYGHWW